MVIAFSPRRVQTKLIIRERLEELKKTPIDDLVTDTLKRQDSITTKQCIAAIVLMLLLFGSFFAGVRITNILTESTRDKLQDYKYVHNNLAAELCHRDFNQTFFKTRFNDEVFIVQCEDQYISVPKRRE